MQTTLYAFVLLFLSSMAYAQNTPKGQIKAIRLQFNEAIVQHDSTNIASFLTDDYTMVSSRNTEVKGKEAGQRALANEFRTRKNVVYVRTPIQIDVFEPWNMASETGQWKGSWQEPDGTVIVSGTYYAKWHKVGEVWKIRSEVFTPVRCSGSSYCERAPEVK